MDLQASQDRTFRNYTAQQAASYAKHRASYSTLLYDRIIQYHAKSGGGSFETLLDIGCGPGNATRELAGYFDHVVGIDPGIEMITRARGIGGSSRAGNQIVFEVGAAEDLEQLESIAANSVDVISSAMAAHWFRMADFWPQAAKILKPGGTVALWTKSSLYCHPSTPNASAVQQALNKLEDVILGPYESPSNRISRSMYDALTLPWNLNPPEPAFPQCFFYRCEWNRDGQLQAGETDFFGGSEHVTLAELEDSLGTASMVTKWREANTLLVGTEQDCVKATMRTIAEAISPDAQHLSDVRLRVGSATALLLLRKE